MSENERVFGARELEELETVWTSFEGLQLAVILEDQC
jgi:hypothetical protein